MWYFPLSHYTNSLFGEKCEVVFEGAADIVALCKVVSFKVLEENDKK